MTVAQNGTALLSQIDDMSELLERAEAVSDSCNFIDNRLENVCPTFLLPQSGPKKMKLISGSDGDLGTPTIEMKTKHGCSSASTDWLPSSRRRSTTTAMPS